MFSLFCAGKPWTTRTTRTQRITGNHVQMNFMHTNGKTSINQWNKQTKRNKIEKWRNEYGTPACVVDFVLSLFLCFFISCSVLFVCLMYVLPLVVYFRVYDLLALVAYCAFSSHRRQYHHLNTQFLKKRCPAVGCYFCIITEKPQLKWEMDERGLDS